MRVAVAVATLSLLATLPTALSYDECAAPGSLSACQTIGAQRPASPPGVPTLPASPYWGTYYLWLGAGRCVAMDLNDCRGFPSAPESGVPLPDGSRTVGLGTFGMLYQESNGMAGLQRYVTLRPGDRMVLV